MKYIILLKAIELEASNQEEAENLAVAMVNDISKYSGYRVDLADLGHIDKSN